MNKQIMRLCGLGKEVEKVEGGKCPCCYDPIDATKFKDELSLKEFGISGLCQSCQDALFD